MSLYEFAKFRKIQVLGFTLFKTNIYMVFIFFKIFSVTNVEFW